MSKALSIEIQENKVILGGKWTIKSIEKLPDNFFEQITFPTYPLVLDGTSIEELDTAGANLITNIKNRLEEANVSVTLEGFSKNQTSFLELIKNSKEKISKASRTKKKNVFYRLGYFATEKVKECFLWLSFVGEFSLVFFKLLLKPKLIPFKSIIATIDFSGVKALPIIAFLSLLIGVVLTYQIGLQLEYYGANIYIVNFLGLGILREFGPLIAAIILAGRTTSSFAAQIGLMQVNEEVDALKTMGLSPLVLLVFPRIVGLIIAMPLLTMWSDLFGLLGGMFMSRTILDVSTQTFLNQFPQVIQLSSLVIGLVKAPVFALIISSVGCFHGLRVSGSATSIGEHTTKSVVLAIFLIIIADAIFSVALSFIGL